MLNQSHCKSNTNIFQPQLLKWYKLIKPLYLSYVPSSIRHRRNISQSKLSDVLILSLLCFQVDLKITVQTRFYHYLQSNIFLNDELPERSRFNRLCRNAMALMQWIRLGVVNSNELSPIYTIIDSLPLPLCLPIRNVKAKALKEYANIGYNATKKAYYYGLKGSFEIDNKGNIRAYALSKASIHDVKMVKTLINEFSSSYILADQGYIDKKLKEELKRKGITLWTPVRKNMKQPKEDVDFLKRKRRYIETVFSKLVSLFDIERIRVNSISGFVSRLEQCLLVYTLENIN